MGSEQITIFLASPGDVRLERDVVAAAVAALNRDPSITEHAHLALQRWDDPITPMPFVLSESPQTTVETTRVPPARCDIVFGILWSQLGTRLPPDLAGTNATATGTTREIDQALGSGTSEVLLYRKTQVPALPVNLPDWERRTRDWADVERYLSELRTRPDGRARGLVREFASTNELRRVVGADLRTLIGRRLRIEIAPQPSSRSPYPGLSAFTPADADYFFGRDAAVGELVDRVLQTPLVAVVGASGSGKSSIVAAGLLPRLAVDERSVGWTVPAFDSVDVWRGRMTPADAGGDPVRGLCQVLESAGGASSTDDVAVRCRTAVEAAQRAGECPMVYIDQFEELFTPRTNRAAANRFLTLIVDLVNDGLLRVVLTMRSEFLDSALRHDGFAQLLQRGTVPLGPPSLDSVREMITGPARRAGLVFERDLADRVLIAARDEPGALPLLAYAMSLVFEGRDGRLLLESTYREIGGVTGAIRHAAEERINRLQRRHRGVLDRLPEIFGQLVEVDDGGRPTRRRMSVDVKGVEADVRLLVDALVEARLLVRSGGEGRPATVEVAHEALFRSWPELAGWIDAAHEDMRWVSRVRRASADWHEDGCDPADQWPQERIDAAHLAARRLGRAYRSGEERFLEPELARLLAELCEETTGHARRRDIATRLGQLTELGVVRAGTGVLPDGRPDIVWREVPQPDGSSIWLSKFPVTLAQMTAFRSDVTMITAVAAAAAQPAAARWTEAAEFCQWLDDRLPDRPGNAPSDYSVRLPTVAEWTNAIGAGRFPWGDTEDESRANTASSKLAEAVAVGLYPRGDTANGVSDLAGTIWEWCFDAVHREEGFDGLEHHRILRVLKGGSALESWDDCAADSFREMRGDTERTDRGFRLCLGPAVNAGSRS